MMEKGNAARMSMFWKPSIPPEYIKMATILDNIMPQAIFTLFDGFNCPPVLHIPMTRRFRMDNVRTFET